MKMKKLLSLILVVALSTFLSTALFSDDHKDHDHKEHDHKDGHIKAKNGGVILEVGEHVAHIELVHHKKEGEVKLFILNKEGQELKITEAPKLNLFIKTDQGKSKKQVVCQSVTDHKESAIFVAKDEVFKTENFSGKIAIKIEQKMYQVELKHDHHGHDHDHKHD